MTCPNCGREFEGERCPNCGRPTFRTGNRIVAVLIAVFLVLPCAAFGACSVMLVGGAGQRNLGDWAITAGLIAFSVVGFVGLCYLVARLWRG